MTTIDLAERKLHFLKGKLDKRPPPPTYLFD